MRVAGIPKLACKTKVDALLQANVAQALGQCGDAVSTEALCHAFEDRYALLGSGLVEVEGGPGDGEGVVFAGGVDFLVEGDGFVEFLFADVALLLFGSALCVSGE
jgi:hypothetical protein